MQYNSCDERNASTGKVTGDKPAITNWQTDQMLNCK